METPKCSSIDDWIKKMWCIYMMEYYSAIRKDETLPFVTCMDVENIMLSEVNQMEKVRTICWI